MCYNEDMVFMVNYIIVTRPLSKPEVSLPEVDLSQYGQNTVENVEIQTETCPYSNIDLSGLPSYYYNPFPLLMGAFTSFFWVLILAIMSQVIIWGLVAIFFIFKRKEYTCPKCKRKYKYSKTKPKRCMYCGAMFEEELKAH